METMKSISVSNATTAATICCWLHTFLNMLTLAKLYPVTFGYLLQSGLNRMADWQELPRPVLFSQAGSLLQRGICVSLCLTMQLY